MDKVLNPNSLEEAVRFLEQNPGAKVLAGGTDLMVLLARGGKTGPLVNIAGIEGLGAITGGEEKLAIGPLVTHSALTRYPLDPSMEVLRQGCGVVGSPQIRNRGTLAGNIANASPAADSAPALLVMEAEVRTIGPGRIERAIPLNQFFLAPGQNALQPGEIISAVELPRMPAGTKGKYLKLGVRQALEVSIVGLAVVRLPGGSWRIALASVSATPLRACLAEEILTRDERAIDEAVDALNREIRPIDDLRASAAYRREMAAAMLRQTWGSISKEVGGIA